MKILVTGANGFLGSWMCKHLVESGHEVSALVRKNSDLTDLEGLPIKYILGDVTDIESLMAGFKNHQAVYHLAGVVAYKKKDRELMQKVNVDGTKNVVLACEKSNIQRLLHLSSVVAVGASFHPEILNENSPYTISNLDLGYFETKHQAEKIVLDAVSDGRIDAVCVNPSTIYGFADAKKGSRKTQVKVAQGKFPFYTSGGVNVVPVEKVVEGARLAYEKGIAGQRYILSSQNYTIKDLFALIAQEAGVTAPSILLPYWLLHTVGFIGDQLNVGISQENAYTASMFHWFSSDKAQKELGFNPGSAEKAIENSIRWMKDHKIIES